MLSKVFFICLGCLYYFSYGGPMTNLAIRIGIEDLTIYYSMDLILCKELAIIYGNYILQLIHQITFLSLVMYNLCFVKSSTS